MPRLRLINSYTTRYIRNTGVENIKLLVELNYYDDMVRIKHIKFYGLYITINIWLAAL